MSSSDRALDLFTTVPPVRVNEEPVDSVLVHQLACLSAALEKERAEAPCRVDELLGLEVPAARRLERAVEPPFRTWGVAELLARRAAEQTEPERSEELALLGLAVAAKLTEHPTAIVADLTARLWAVRGQARLSSGDLAGSQEALSAASACLERGTGDLLTEATLFELEARVLETQDRPREAASLLRQAATRYSEIGDRTGQMRVRGWRDRLLSRPEGATR